MTSDQQWEKIKHVLKRVGVDADTVTAGKRPLRDELDRLDAKYAELANRKPPLTVKQLRDTVGDYIAQIDALRESSAPDRIETMYVGDGEAAELRGLLDRIKGNLVRQLKANQFDGARDAPEIVQRGQCMEMQRPKGGNARKLQNEYWIALVKLWRQLVPQTTSKDVVTFVEIITGAKPETIRSYLYRSGAT
jgi:hypothetical protein